MKDFNSIVQDPSWFSKWFDSSFYHQLYANRDENEAKAFIDELLLELQPVEAASMLDLGCGSGRHARYLASNGFNVTGIDLASSSIRTAKQSKMENLQFYRHDMRVPFGNDRYDFVFNFFTSFGYFKEDRENLQIVRNIFNSLKPGGMVVFDYMNAAYASSRLIASEQKEIDGISYDITRWEDETNIYKKIQVGNLHEFTEQVQKFTIFDFDCMFRKAGLQLQKVYGDYELGEYDRETSPRLILLAKKPA